MYGLLAYVLIFVIDAAAGTYCNPKAQTWKESVEDCESNGRSLAPFETGLGNTLDACHLTAGTEIWTADYAFESTKDGLNFTNEKLCGFGYLNSTMLSPEEQRFGDCNENRNYICKNTTTFELDVHNGTRESMHCNEAITSSDMFDYRGKITPGYYWTSQILYWSIGHSFVLPKTKRVLCGAFTLSVGNYFINCDKTLLSLCKKKEHAAGTYCNPKAQTWKEAVEDCESNGRSLAPIKTGLDNTLDACHLTAGTEIWTADYAFEPTQDGINFTNEKLCGFGYLNSNMLSPEEQRFGDCNENRNYFCKNTTSFELDVHNGPRESMHCKEAITSRDMFDYRGKIIPGYYWTSQILSWSIGHSFVLPKTTRVLCGAFTLSAGHYFINCDKTLFSFCKNKALQPTDVTGSDRFTNTTSINRTPTTNHPFTEPIPKTTGKLKEQGNNLELQLIYNNKSQSWWEAVTKCLRSGGAPVSYHEAIDKDMSDVNLNTDTTIWTAEFAIDVKIPERSDRSYERVCGFSYIDNENVNRSPGSWEVLYGDCLKRRNYFYREGPEDELETLSGTFFDADSSKSFRQSDLLNTSQEIIPGFYWTVAPAYILPEVLKSGGSVPSSKTTYLCGVYGRNTGHHYAFCSTHRTSLCYYAESRVTDIVTKVTPGSHITSTAREEPPGQHTNDTGQSHVNSLATAAAPGIELVVGISACLWIVRLVFL